MRHRLTAAAVLVTVGLMLSGCSARPPIARPPVTVPPLAEPEPQRVVTQPGDTTNVCVDALEDVRGSSGGFDIDTVTISRTEETFTYSLTTNAHVDPGFHVWARLTLYPVGQREGGVGFETHIIDGKRFRVNAWTVATRDRYIQDESAVVWTGSEVTTTVPKSLGISAVLI